MSMPLARRDSSVTPACESEPAFPKLFPGEQLESSRTDKSMERLSFEQLAVGQQWTSPSRTVTETDVVNFANFTGDHNPLHVDHEFAKNTPYRQPIAHGLMGLSWVAGLGSNSPSVETVAFAAVRNWEFSRPIFFGDTVHVLTEVIGKQDNAKRAGRVVWRMKLLNQRGEVTQHGEFETLVKVRHPVRRAAQPHFNPNSADSSKSDRRLES